MNFSRRSRLPLTYDHEPIQNIALSRNRAVRAAQGNLLAFLDDDELPCWDWLKRLHVALKNSGASGVLGPVRPSFPPEAPDWLIKSRLCDRPSHASGTILNFMQTRTGNALIDRKIIREADAPFRPELGKTGGEDIAFFRMMMARGFRFIWCEEAPVFEIVLPERFARKYYIQKNLRIGGLTGEELKGRGAEKWKALFLSSGSVLLYGLWSTVGILFGSHVFMRHITKTAYHLARIAGVFGFVPIRERSDT